MAETYLIDTWYVRYADGGLLPCYNYKTARYLVDIGDAEAVVYPTTELLKK